MTAPYVLDALYGVVHLPSEVMGVLTVPELQRLREVRLCNINSLNLTGGATLNRFEHSVGTCHLADVSASVQKSLTADQRRTLLLAALLHDIGTTAFGHSVQYLLDQSGYEHDSLDRFGKFTEKGKGYKYQHATFEKVFFGLPRRLADVLSPSELRKIAVAVKGLPPVGPLISNAVDLDNIDNVFRFAYHLGIVARSRAPLELASSLILSRGKIVLRRGGVEPLAEWHATRKRLYSFLLRNPEEFSAKAMLEEALTSAYRGQDSPLTWHDVDFELLEKLSRSSPDVASTVTRIMVGDLYGCLAIFVGGNREIYSQISQVDRRSKLERLLSEGLKASGLSFLRAANVALHAIDDTNKTDRSVNLPVEGNGRVVLGDPSPRVLVGVFLRNKSLGLHSLNQHRTKLIEPLRRLRLSLEKALRSGPITQLPLYGEAYEA